MKKKIISWSLFLSWLLVIFFFSSQNGGESSNLSNGILSSFLKIIPFSVNQSIFSFGIRKLAHFTEYAILGILTINLLKNYKEIKWKEVILAGLFCFLYSCSDEFHQTFVGGRNGSILDVFIDTCGAWFGIINYLLLKRKH